MRKVLIFLFVLITFLAQSQSRNFRWYWVVPNTNTSFGIPLLKDQVLFHPLTNKWYKLTADVTASESLSSVFTANKYAEVPDITIAWPATYTPTAHTQAISTITNLSDSLKTYVPKGRTLTINGTTYNLNENRTWSVGTLTVESDPVFAGDSSKILHWSDTIAKITTAYDLATHVQTISRVTGLQDTIDRHTDTLQSHNTRINNLVKYDNKYEINISNDSENNWSLPFELRTSSVILYNGDPLRSTQWSASSPTILTVTVDVRKYDHIVLIN